MNRRLIGLLAAFCLLSACNKTPEPVGKLEPLPGASAPSAAKPPPAPPPPAPLDASQVRLRWKLTAPIAYQFTLSGASAAPAAAAPTRGKTRGARRGSRKKGAPEAPAESETPVSSAAQALSLFFLLHTDAPADGALPFALLPESPTEETQRGTMSERGFVLASLGRPWNNLAVMVLELPTEAVRQGSTWTVATDLLSMDALPPGFRQKDAQQKSEVKLTALTPGADGERVATLEYELFESISGQQGPLRPGRRGHSHEHAPIPVKKPARGAKPAKTPPAPELSAEVRVSGRGEFLVKAGRWRSWEARMNTRTDGLTLPGLFPGERTLRLTPVEPVPATLLQRLTTK